MFFISNLKHVLRILILGTLSLNIQHFGSSALAQEASLQCDNKNGLGVSRVLNIDTTGGPRFGHSHDHFNDHVILSDGEVIITIDDGPSPHTLNVLNTLDEYCTKATFFLIGYKVASFDKSSDSGFKVNDENAGIAKLIARRGHTIAGHSYSHRNMGEMSAEKIRNEVNDGIEALELALGEEGKVANFFRFPGLNQDEVGLKFLEGQDISAFSIDVDSNDWKRRKVEAADLDVEDDECKIMKRVNEDGERFYWPDEIVASVMEQLAVRRKGIILLHDIHCRTAEALPTLLEKLREEDYFVVHLKDAN